MLITTSLLCKQECVLSPAQGRLCTGSYPEGQEGQSPLWRSRAKCLQFIISVPPSTGSGGSKASLTDPEMWDMKQRTRTLPAQTKLSLGLELGK